MFRRLIVMPLAVLLLCAADPPVSAQEHAGQYSQADIDRGARLYGTNCRICHGDNGDAMTTVDLRSGRFRRAATDEELSRVVVNGIPGTAMPPHKLEPADVNGIVAFVRSLRGRAQAAAAGDAGRGRELFEGKGECLKCHRVAGKGSRTGPDLSDAGDLLDGERIRRALVDPTAVLRPLNRPVRALTRDGKAISGRRLNEDTYSVQLIDSEERLVSLMKSDLREYTISTTSAMPSYAGRLSAQELADIVAYLRTLRGLE